MFNDIKVQFTCKFSIWLSTCICFNNNVKKRKGHLQVDIDPKMYSKLRKLAKKQGKSVDDLVREIFLSTIKNKKR